MPHAGFAGRDPACGVCCPSVQLDSPKPVAAQPDPSKFDAYAQNYTHLHRKNIAATGEDPEYFARYKIACLERLGIEGPVLDYGCGIGNLTRYLVEAFDHVHGTDPSSESLRVATERVPGATFSELPPTDVRFNTAVLAGVLHHIRKEDRLTALARVRDALSEQGRVVVFEHNPLNPITQKAVRECPFDDDAVLLYPWELRQLLRDAGFRRVEQQYIVFFPRALRALRPLEPRLGWLCLGAQTLTVAER